MDCSNVGFAARKLVAVAVADHVHDHVHDHVNEHGP
jgi:hypothetical protein